MGKISFCSGGVFQTSVFFAARPAHCKRRPQPHTTPHNPTLHSHQNRPPTPRGSQARGIFSFSSPRDRFLRRIRPARVSLCSGADTSRSCITEARPCNGTHILYRPPGSAFFLTVGPPCCREWGPRRIMKCWYSLWYEPGPDAIAIFKFFMEENVDFLVSAAGCSQRCAQRFGVPKSVYSATNTDFFRVA